MRIAIDTGGTFTDVVAIDETTGAHFAIKTPSTPHDPSVGLIEGIRKAAEAAGVATSDISQLLHGSTTATNAVLEHKFDGLGLIVTKGFRHIIEIARQSVPDGYGNSFFWVKPPRLVPLHLVREVGGRMTHEGVEIESLDEDDVYTALSTLRENGVKSVGVCLIHSYASGAHEQRIGELAAQHFPELFISLSSIVLPEYREYERAMTTLIDVMVKPHCETYLTSATNKVRQKARDIPVLIMQSNGGVVSSDTAAKRPVTMLLSGPAAGVLGATYMARLAGYENILTLDVGGTSTDVSLVEQLSPKITSHSMVENYPVKTPMLDIATVGTGGGSLAWLDNYGGLKVGPQSAGADPGPICYRRGGVKPSVTDAAVVLGRLPTALLGGEIALDGEAARLAFTELAGHFGMTTEEAAAGVFEIAAANQVNGIRQVTVMKGREPKDYALIAFGGAGGMFATDVADFLDITVVISPPDPGNLSAFGLHVSDIKRDYIRTLVRQQSKTEASEIEEAWSQLEEQGAREIAAEGVASDDIAIRRSSDMRYVGEGHEVAVDVPTDVPSNKAVDYLWREFHRVHEQTFGFEYEGEQDVEVVNLRVEAIGLVHRPKMSSIRTGKVPANTGTRPVYWRERGWTDCPIFNRIDLKAQNELAGPIIVEEYGSTIVVPQPWLLRVDDYGNLIMEKPS